METNISPKINIDSINDKVYSIEDVRYLYKKYIVSTGTVSGKISISNCKNRIKFIGNLLSLDYIETSENVYFSQDLYSKIEEFYIEERNKIKGSNDLINHIEAYKLITGISNSSKSNEKLKCITKIAEPRAYINGRFYYNKLDIVKIKNYLVDIDELYRIFCCRVPSTNIRKTTLAKNIKLFFPEKYIEFLNGKCFYYKYVLDKIDFNSLRGGSTLKKAIERSLNGYSVQRVADLLRVEFKVAKKLLEEGKYIYYEDHTKIYANKESVDKWVDFQNTYVSLDDIYNKVEDNVGNKYEVKKRTKQEYYRQVRNCSELKKFNLIYQEETCFPRGYAYIHKDEEKKVKSLIKQLMEKQIVFGYGTKLDKLEYEINNSNYKKCVKSTVNYFEEYAFDRMSKTIGVSYISMKDIFINIIKLDKELIECNDDEVFELLKNLYTKDARNELCYFLEFLQKNISTKFKTNYTIDKNHRTNKNKINKKPYSMEQYFRFGFLALSDTHVWYESYIKKAASSRKYSSIWLYAVLHYTCVWRGIDLRSNIPRPVLNISAADFINRVKNNTLSDEIARDVAEQIEFKIKNLNLKPKKTRRYDAPKLVMEIPESIKVLLGILLGLCESHLQLSNDKRIKNLISGQCKEKKLQQEFFGDEFIEIFKDEGLSNLRLSKNYEMLTVKNAEEEHLGTGHIIAAIARSHKLKGNKKNKTTSVYLEYYYKMDDSEKLIREMFERGVCSFVPYILAKIIKGSEDIKKLDYIEQRNLINDLISIENHSSELLIQVFAKVIERSRVKVNEIIEFYQVNSDNPRESIKKFLDKVACNASPSKSDNNGCITVAQGLGCIKPKRKHCIGCGQEIYLKSYLNELGNYINKTRMNAYHSKTEGSKRKNILLIQTVLAPIVEDILITLNKVYGVEDLSAYLELVNI